MTQRNASQISVISSGLSAVSGERPGGANEKT
jgi:hypothetical protein